MIDYSRSQVEMAFLVRHLIETKNIGASELTCCVQSIDLVK